MQYALVIYEQGKGARDDEARGILELLNKRLPPSSDVKAALVALAADRGDFESAG